MSEENKFKLIVALKFTQDIQSGLKCNIIIGDKIKESSLPLSEGQFFDLSNMPHHVRIVFFNQHQQDLCKLQIDIPPVVHEQEETEIAEQFNLKYEDKNSSQQIQGSYYVIVLNKKIFLQKNQQTKKVKFLEEVAEKRVSTQPNQRKSHKSSIPKTYSPNVKKNKKNQVSVKDKVNEVVKTNLSKFKDIQDKENVNYTQVYNQERGSCLILDKLKSHYDVQSCETTPRVERKDEINSTTPMRVTPSRVGKPQKITKSITGQSLSPMVRQGQDTKLTNYKTQNEYLKYAVWSLDQQISQLNCNARMNSTLKEELISSDHYQDDLHVKLRDCQRSNEKQIQIYNEQIAEMLDNQVKLRQSLEDKSALALRYENECCQHQLTIKHKDQEILEFNKKYEDNKVLEQRFYQQETTVNQLSQLNHSLKEDLIQLNLKRNEEVFQLESAAERLSKEKWTIRQQYSDMQFELQKAQTLIEQQEFQLLTYDRSSASAQSPSDRQVQTFLEEQQIHLKQIADLRYQNQGLVQALDSSKQQLSKQTNKRIEEERLQCDSQELLKRKLIERENHIGSLNQFVEQIRLQNQNVKTQLLKLEQYEQLYNDISQELSRLKNKFQVVVEANDQLNEYLEEAHSVNQQLQDEKLQSALRITEMEGQMSEREGLLNNMKHAIIHQREKGGQYIPYPNDQIDRKVSEFLLEKDERLKYILIREQEGVYSFGTRRLFFKTEQDKLYVRTGGGFVKIEIFFDVATIEAEMDRVDRMSDHTNLQQKKMYDKKLAQQQSQSQPQIRNILQSKN